VCNLVVAGKCGGLDKGGGGNDAQYSSSCCKASNGQDFHCQRIDKDDWQCRPGVEGSQSRRLSSLSDIAITADHSDDLLMTPSSSSTSSFSSSRALSSSSSSASLSRSKQAAAKSATSSSSSTASASAASQAVSQCTSHITPYGAAHQDYYPHFLLGAPLPLLLSNCFS
jgi:hypothetical protein